MNLRIPNPSMDSNWKHQQSNLAGVFDHKYQHSGCVLYGTSDKSEDSDLEPLSSDLEWQCSKNEQSTTAVILSDRIPTLNTRIPIPGTLVSTKNF